MKNSYKIKGNITEVYFRNKDGFFLIDTDDLEKVSQYTWYLNDNGYVCTTKNAYCHHLIIGKPVGKLVVDHKNRNRLDNRKDNLHFCTQSENNKNRDYVQHKRVSIRFHKGVRKDSYRVDIHDSENKTIYIGTYPTFEKATEIRDKAYLLCEQGALTPFQIKKLRTVQ